MVLNGARKEIAAKHYVQADSILHGHELPGDKIPDWLVGDPELKRLQAQATKGIPREMATNARAAHAAEASGRRQYARTLREHFLDKGLDIKVSVAGSNADTLHLHFALFNDVWVHNFRKGDLSEEIRGMGFKRVEFEDGFNYDTVLTYK